jgi:hypothetical protein
MAADPDHGKLLVERWCASCHLVEPKQKGSTTEAPPFASVAGRADFDPAKIAIFLLDPHPKMPNMQLTRNGYRSLHCDAQEVMIAISPRAAPRLLVEDPELSSIVCLAKPFGPHELFQAIEQAVQPRLH